MTLRFGADFTFTPAAQSVTAAAVLSGNELRISAVNPTLTVDGIDQVTITAESEQRFTIQGVGEIGAKVYLPLVAR